MHEMNIYLLWEMYLSASERTDRSARENRTECIELLVELQECAERYRSQ